MFEAVHPLFLLVVGLTFGIQALWGASTGNYFRHSGFRLVTATKFERPIEYRVVMVVQSLVASAAFGVLVVKVGIVL